MANTRKQSKPRERKPSELEKHDVERPGEHPGLTDDLIDPDKNRERVPAPSEREPGLAEKE